MDHGANINTADSQWDRESEDTVGSAGRQIKAMSATAPTAEQTANSWMWLLQWCIQIIYMGEMSPAYSDNSS